MANADFLTEPRVIASRGSDENSIIDLISLTKSFSGVAALQSLSLSVNRGEIYGLLGPNGAGKSTTVNIVCGLLQPDSGSVIVAGVDRLANPRAAKRMLGVVPQELALYTELTARENLHFFGRLYGMRGSNLEKRINELLEMVHLQDRGNSIVGTFSGGMQRRLNIAAGLMHKPAVILMDEPTVGLDPQNRANILEIVRRVASEGAAVLYSTHYMDEVEKICDRIGIIDHGKLLIEGTLAELRARAGGKEVLTLRGSFDASEAVEIFRADFGETFLRSSSEEIAFNLTGAEHRLSAILGVASRAGEVRAVEMNRQSLESLFIQLTGRELRE